MWYVYIVECRDKTLYTGITNNVDSRLKQHNLGKGSKYTRGRVPVKLKYQEEHPDKISALKKEHYFKKWTRAEKLIFIKNSGKKTR